MTISYPLVLPTDWKFQSIQFSLDHAVGVSESPFTFTQQVHNFGGERWRLNVVCPPRTPELARSIIAFMGSLGGMYGTFMAGDPLLATPQGAASGTPLVMGAGQTGKVLITDGWTPSITNILRAGDVIQIGESMYLILKDVNSNGSGQATLDVAPPLRSTATDNATIIVTSPKQKFRLSEPVTWSSDFTRFFDFSFSAVEVLP